MQCSVTQATAVQCTVCSAVQCVQCSAVQCSVCSPDQPCGASWRYWRTQLTPAGETCTWTMECTALHCTVLDSTVLHCISQYFNVLCRTALHCKVLHCRVLYSIALHCTAWLFVALHIEKAPKYTDIRGPEQSLETRFPMNNVHGTSRPVTATLPIRSLVVLWPQTSRAPLGHP